jgi:hypothetical protein
VSCVLSNGAGTYSCHTVGRISDCRISRVPLRLVLYLKNLEIYFSRDLHFSRFFVLCYPNLEKKNLEFFFSSFFGVNLAIIFCEVNLEFFSRFSFLEFFFLSFTSTKSRDFLSKEFLSFSLYQTSRVLCLCVRHTGNTDTLRG